MTKTAELNKCREILHSYSPGEIISFEDEIAFLIDIFQRHPDWDQKKGVGIKHVYVDMESMYKGKCFFIERVDGTKTDISFIKSIQEINPLYIIKKACRNAVKDYVIDFRNKNVVYGVTTCPITGEVLTKENTHIDHYNKTFDELCEKWISIEGFTSAYAAIKPTKDMDIGYSFGVNSIKQSFIDYHNKNTHLRAVSKRANLSELKKQSSEHKNKTDMAGFKL